MIDAMKGAELPAAAPKSLSPSAEAQSRTDEAEAILWHSAQQMNFNEVEGGQTKYIFECRANVVANGLLKAHQSEQNRMIHRLAKFSPRNKAWCPLVPNC